MQKLKDEHIEEAYNSVYDLFRKFNAVDDMKKIPLECFLAMSRDLDLEQFSLLRIILLFHFDIDSIALRFDTWNIRRLKNVLLSLVGKH